MNMKSIAATGTGLFTPSLAVLVRRFLGLHAIRAPIHSVQRVGCTVPTTLLKVRWVDFSKHLR